MNNTKTSKMNKNKRILSVASLVMAMILSPSYSPNLFGVNAAFMPSSSSFGKNRHQVSSQFMGRTMKFQPNRKNNKRAATANKRGGSTALGMFLGSDGGILGVGTPEVLVIVLVGYFILGPTELFKLTKEIGKFIQNARTLGSEASKTFESTMENQVEIQELRKAQSELNKAFDFRRSINVDQESDAFSELPPIADSAATATAEAATATAEGAAAAAATATAATATAAKPKKKKRRRVKKKKVEEPVMQVPPPPLEDGAIGNIPDLDMSSAFKDEFMDQMGVSDMKKSNNDDNTAVNETEAEMAARVRKDRIARLEKAQEQSESDLASEVLSQQDQIGLEASPEENAAAQSRFEAQLNGNWNQQVLANEDKLSPLGQVMEQLALLEEEREAMNKRLDEEFARRAEIEERFYREKRTVLEQAAGDVSASVYQDFDFSEYEEKVEEIKSEEKEDENDEKTNVDNGDDDENTKEKTESKEEDPAVEVTDEKDEEVKSSSSVDKDKDTSTKDSEKKKEETVSMSGEDKK